MKLTTWLLRIFRKNKIEEANDPKRNEHFENDDHFDMDIYSKNNYGNSDNGDSISWASIEKSKKEKAKELIESLPKEPGVYFWKQGEEIVYIGQSINVKKRTAEHILGDKSTLAFDRHLRRDLDEFEVTYKPCKKEELSELEVKFIKEWNPKHNHHSNFSNARINNKRTEYKVEGEIKGIDAQIVNIKGEIFTITGSFKNNEGSIIARAMIINILTKLDGIFSSSGKKDTKVWLVGDKPGKKVEKIDDDDIKITHPFKIKGFKEEYQDRMEN